MFKRLTIGLKAYVPFIAISLLVVFAIAASVRAGDIGSTLNMGDAASGTLSTTRGGSGVSNPTAHGVMLSEGSSPFNLLPMGADTILHGLGSSTDSEALPIPSCSDTGGNHLNYSTSTHTFSCGTSGSGTGFVSYLAGVSVPQSISAGSITGTIPSGTVSGDLLIAALNAGAGGQPSAVPTAPVGWSLVGTGAANTGGSPKSIAAFYSRTSNGADSNPTFTPNTSAFLSLAILDFHGLPVGAVDSTGTAYGTVNSSTTGLLNCAGAVASNEVVIQLMTGTNGASNTPTSLRSTMSGIPLFVGDNDNMSNAIYISQVIYSVTGTRIIPEFDYFNGNSQNASMGCIFVH